MLSRLKLSRFKLGMLLTCAPMGAAFVQFFFAKDMAWAWITVGIAFMIAGILIPSLRAWSDRYALVLRLIFFLTSAALGACVSLGIHRLCNEHPTSATAWFLFAAGALWAFVTVEDD